MANARRPISELQRLIALIANPAFPWVSAHGQPSTGVERACDRRALSRPPRRRRIAEEIR